MMPPTGNAKKVYYPDKEGDAMYMHGAAKAIDYRAIPDPIIYAPEDLTFDSYQQRGVPGTTGDAGMALRARGAHGLHQFAHTSESYFNGGTVKKGARIAKMGHTGYTIPSGPAGTHLHYWVKRPDGTFAYPPSLYTEPFNTNQGGNEVSTVGEVELDMLSRAFFGYPANAEFIKAWKGTESNTMIRWCEANPAHTAWLKQIETWKNSASNGEFVEATVYVKKG